MEVIVFEDRSIQLVRSNRVSDAFITQIRNTVLGQEGHLQYHSDDAAINAPRLENTSFLELRWKNRLIGCIALSVKDIRTSGKESRMLYVRYFSISGLLHSHQGTVGSSKSSSSNTIKKLIVKAFDHPDKLSDSSGIHGICAYVEDHNLPSLRNVSMTGFTKVDTFTTWIYSRIRPKSRLAIQKADKDIYQQSIYPLLDRYYSDYDLVPSWTDLTGEQSRKYYYYEENGKILCAVSVEQKHWIVKKLPGRMDLLNKAILAHLPLLKNIFFTDKLAFLALEMAYIAESSEHLFPLLVESVLSRHQLHHAFIWTSVNSPIAQQITKSGNFGLIQRLRKASTAGVYYKSFGRTKPSAPCYVSAEGIS
jgi:DNA-binding PadR family transcriptional regulator